MLPPHWLLQPNSAQLPKKGYEHHGRRKEGWVLWTNPDPDHRFSQDRASTKLCSESKKVGLVVEGWWQDMRCSFVNTQSITST